MSEICVRVYIGLGSNLAAPIQRLRDAVIALRLLPQSKLLQGSNIYQNSPVGNVPQPDFFNAVVALETTLSPNALLQQLQTIEQQQGRERTTYWGPRTLDLDLLLYADKVINTTDLILPHSELQRRFFVLAPLVEIAPDLVLPDGQLAQEVLAQLEIPVCWENRGSIL